MKSILAPDLRDVAGREHYPPAVSIIMPFEPKMLLKTVLAHSLKIALCKVERELFANYPGELAILVLNKLKIIIKDLNYNTHKKSIAIYVSPVFEKVLYLNMSVEEKIMVDESFGIRDLVYSKKQLHKYLLLQLTSKVTRIYLGNSGTLVRIVSNTQETIHAYADDIPGRIAPISDIDERKEMLFDNFLHHIDNTLEIILDAYRLPLFVIGSEKLLGDFKKFSKHSTAIIEYVKGNSMEATLEELNDALEPHITDWKTVVQKDLLNQLEKASNEKKLVMGLTDVWRDASSHKGRLLVVEKNYKYTAPNGEAELNDRTNEPYNKFSFVRNAVDGVIEKVLEGGGDVELVDKDLLKSYQHIALVKYY